MAKKAELESPPISLAKSNRGLTLIEILITVAIIAAVVAIGVPRLGRSLGSQIRAISRKIIVLNKQIHHSARLKNKTYRLVIDFGNDTEGRDPLIIVESATGAQLLADPEATPDRFAKNDDKKKKGPFSPDTEMLKKPITLPTGVRFLDVETENNRDPVKEGRAYIYFFANGLVTRSIIHITNGDKMNWSLIVNPLTARTDIQDKIVTMKDLE
jgi:general secretion pathway protein H